MRTIKTASGHTYEIRFCGVLQQYANKALYIEFIGETLPDLAAAFSDPDTCSVIYSYVDGEPHKTFIGFTSLVEAGKTGENIYLKLETYAEKQEIIVEEIQG